MSNIIFIIILVGVSAFFSATEIAYASVNPARLKSRRQEKDSVPLMLACKVYDRYSGDTLSTILIGNNLANTASSSIATLIVMELDLPSWVATVVMTLVVLTFGEIIPKVLAKQLPETFCIIAAVPIYILSLIFKPLSWLISSFVKLCSVMWKSSVADTDAVSEDDFENIIDIVEDEGVLDEEQCDLLQNALDFDEVLAYEIITPRVDMVAIDAESTREEMLEILLDSVYTRIPVYKDTIDNIIGILHINLVIRALTEDPDADFHLISGLCILSMVIRDSEYLPAGWSTAEALNELNKMGDVTDPYRIELKQLVQTLVDSDEVDHGAVKKYLSE